MAISVGSVEVDVVPNTRGIYTRLKEGLVPAATRAGQDAGDAAGRAFGPAMQGSVGDAIGARIGQQIGEQIASRIASSVRDGLRDGVTQGGRTARPAATRQGDETGGAFSRALRARLEAAFRSLPRAEVRLSDTGFDADMARLRARLETLSNKRIGIDVDVAAALTEITDIEERLRRLGAEHPNVQVRADTAAALAQLAAVRAEIDAVDGKNVDVDTSPSVAAFSTLTTAAAAFGPAIIPVLAVVAAGLGAVASAAVAAGVGIGGIALVAVPAFKQITGVLQAEKQAQDAATTASLRGGQAASQAAQRALQQASAQQALATAQRNAARQIADAERGVSDAQRQAAQANVQAAQQVKAARQSLTDAYQQAADRMEQANRQVASAERDLAAAQKAARQAQADLIQARKDAEQQLEDLNNRLVDSQLSQRDAEIALIEATRQRDAVLKNANSTELDKQKALLAYDQAVQRLKEQTTETQRLKAETAAANRAGVEGSATVKTAQEKLAQAQQDVADRTQALKDAQANAAKVQIQNARAIADAQQKVAEAQKNVAETQRQGAEAVARAQERVVQAQQSAADSIASAQRQIASASLSAAGGVDQAAIAQTKYQQELAKLTPAARQTMNAYVGLRGAFSAWSKSLQPAVMPIFTRALNGMKNALPGLTPFVLAAAKAIGDLQDKASRGFKSPWWQTFKKDLQTSVGPAITGFGVSFGRIFKGIVLVIDAFLPKMGRISETMQRITGKFADWAAGLKGSPVFERFLDFAAQKAPLVGDTIAQIAGALISIGTALAPISGPVLQFIGGLAQGVGWVAKNMPWLVQGIYGAVVAMNVWKLAVAGWALAQRAANIAMTAFNVISKAGPWGWIALAIGAVVLAVVLLYKKCDWFRAAVQAVWGAIKTAAGAVVDWFAGPFARFFTQTIPSVFNTVLNWVKTHWPWILGLLTGPIGLAVVAIIKHWDGIKAGISAAWGWIKTNVLYPIRDFFTRTIPGWANTLKNLVVAAWDREKTGLSNIWNWIKSNILYPIRDFFTRRIPGWANTLKNLVVAAWDREKTGLSNIWNWIKSHVIYPIRDFFTRRIPGWGDTLRKRMVSSFDGARAGIKTAWDKIGGIARKPVAFVVNTVYNNGLRKVWNLVTDAFGGKHLDPMKFATGGIMPGYTPGRDVHLVPSTAGPVALSGGEAIMRPEWTRAVGPAAVHAMNAAARTGGVSGVRALLGFKDGGIFSGIGNALSGAWDKIKKGASWLKSTFSGAVQAGVTHVVNPLIDKIPGGNIGFVRLLKDLMKGAVSRLVGAGKKGDELATPHIKYNPTRGVEQWRPVVLQALREVGQPASLANSTLRRMQQESGGNPTIVNKWDSNWAAGHPSVGLMQVIGPTFRHYAGKYRNKGPFLYGVSVDPMANIYSSMRYALGAYGSLSRAYDRPGGYDSGGWMPPGMNLMYNGLGEPEAVLTPTQWRAIQGAAARGTDGASIGDLSVQVFVGDREITDIARAEVRRSNGELLQALSARPRR